MYIKFTKIKLMNLKSHAISKMASFKDWFWDYDDSLKANKINQAETFGDMEYLSSFEEERIDKYYNTRQYGDNPEGDDND